MDWILSNKEWIFSGIGVFAISFIISLKIWHKNKGKDNSFINNSKARNSLTINENLGKIEVSYNQNNKGVKGNDDEKEIGKQLIIFLEDKRVLYSPYACGCPMGVLDSISDIRRKILYYKTQLEPSSKLFNILTLMQIAVYDFQYYTCKDCETPNCCRDCEIYDKGCINGLHKFRLIFQNEIENICQLLNMEIPKMLKNLHIQKHFE